MANLQQFTNNAASTLNAGISSGATTIVLTSGGGSLFPALSGSQYFYGTLSNATNTVLEIVKVTARTTDTLTVVRAQEGTSASAFSTGDNFQLRVTAAGMNNLGQLDSANTWAQTQAMSISGNAATATTTTGNAGTATKLAATKNIQGVAFDGSADIIVATAGTGISVTGTQIANTGVLTVNGSSGAVTTIKSGTAVATTSGTAVDFTGIPATAKRITVMFSGVSTSGTNSILVQLGSSVSVETTGYFAQAGNITVTSPGVVTSTAGFIVYSAAAASTSYGTLTISLVSANTFVASGSFTNGTTNASYTSGGKTVSNQLDRVRITTVNGTDTFDAGSVNILWE